MQHSVLNFQMFKSSRLQNFNLQDFKSSNRPNFKNLPFPHSSLLWLVTTLMGDGQGRASELGAGRDQRPMTTMWDRAGLVWRKTNFARATTTWNDDRLVQLVFLVFTRLSSALLHARGNSPSLCLSISLRRVFVPFSNTHTHPRLTELVAAPHSRSHGAMGRALQRRRPR
jgi:hypothetical protein